MRSIKEPTHSEEDMMPILLPDEVTGIQNVAILREVSGIILERPSRQRLVSASRRRSAPSYRLRFLSTGNQSGEVADNQPLNMPTGP